MIEVTSTPPPAAAANPPNVSGTLEQIADGLEVAAPIALRFVTADPRLFWVSLLVNYAPDFVRLVAGWFTPGKEFTIEDVLAAVEQVEKQSYADRVGHDPAAIVEQVKRLSPQHLEEFLQLPTARAIEWLQQRQAPPQG